MTTSKPSATPKMLEPDITLLCKLGSIAGHVEEAISDDGHAFDLIALRQLLTDPDVHAWMTAMRAAAFLPVPRKAKP